MSSSLKPRFFDVDLYAVAAAAILALAGGFLVLQPLRQKSVQALSQQQDFRNQIQLAREKCDQLQKMDTMQLQIARSLQNTQNPLEKNHGIPKVRRELQQMARLCGLQLEEIQPQTTQTSAYFTQIRLNLMLYGTSTDLLAYLARIRKQLEFVRVDAFSLETKNPAEPSQCEIHMQLDVFSPK